MEETQNHPATITCFITGIQRVLQLLVVILYVYGGHPYVKSGHSIFTLRGFVFELQFHKHKIFFTVTCITPQYEISIYLPYTTQYKTDKLNTI